MDNVCWKNMAVVCVSCGKLQTVAQDMREEALQCLREHGWVSAGDVWSCPRCSREVDDGDQCPSRHGPDVA